LLTDPRLATIVLTRGGQWTQEIKADAGTVWPSGTVHATFFDTSGGIFADLDGDIDTAVGDTITFDCDPSDTDGIPAGAGFEVFLDTDLGPTYKIRYGKVIRKEISFPTAPSSVTIFQALQYTDGFQRSALGTKWVPVSGRTSIHTNSGLPDGVGPNLGLLYQASSIRYFAPLNGDGVKSSVTLLNPGQGKTTIVVCADQGFTSFLGIQFDTTPSPDVVNIVVGSSPTTMVTKATVNQALANNDRYMAFYDELTNTMAVYKGTSLTPLLTWQDTSHIVPHGPGYRYAGFCWQADLFSTGPQITDWVAQDEAGAAGS
jgi:hypothetical protein